MEMHQHELVCVCVSGYFVYLSCVRQMFGVFANVLPSFRYGMECHCMASSAARLIRYFFCVFSYSLIICYPCGGAALNSNPNNCLLLFDCMIFRGLCYFFYALCQRRKCLQIFLYFAFMHERKLPWKMEKKLTIRFEYFIFVLLFAHEFSLLIQKTVSSCWICVWICEQNWMRQSISLTLKRKIWQLFIQGFNEKNDRWCAKMLDKFRKKKLPDFRIVGFFMAIMVEWNQHTSE